MSGGSFDYAYSHIEEEIGGWESTLRQMADKCREFAGRPDLEINKDRATARAATVTDRAHILVRAMLLDGAADAVRDAAKRAGAVTEIMHTVEWVVSGDSGVYELAEPVKVKP